MKPDRLLEIIEDYLGNEQTELYPAAHFVP
ncbi:MAG: hypothetical protein K0Q75_1334 [Anaerospora sp.]|nr:hypothetical protein [Anaerospora sp.]